MKRTVKCEYCHKTSEIDIPVLKAPRIKWQFVYDELEMEGHSFDIKNIECPFCKKRGGLVVPYTPIKEKIIIISSHNKDYYPLSFRYPVHVVINKIKFKFYEEYYTLLQLPEKYRKTFLSFDRLSEKRNFFNSVPHLDIDKKEIVSKLIQMRLDNDIKFKDLLKSTSGFKIEYSTDDLYLGVRQSGVRKRGENVYGKLLTQYSNKLNDEESF